MGFSSPLTDATDSLRLRQYLSFTASNWVGFSFVGADRFPRVVRTAAFRPWFQLIAGAVLPACGFAVMVGSASESESESSLDDELDPALDVLSGSTGNEVAVSATPLGTKSARSESFLFLLRRCRLAGRVLSCDAEREVERGFDRVRGAPTRAVRESASSSDEFAIINCEKFE